SASRRRTGGGPALVPHCSRGARGAGGEVAPGMMKIVILALRRPYTFICAAILILILGVFAIIRMPVDIFPAIDLPVATVVWTYTGMDPEQIEQRITTISERIFSSLVSNIEHIESPSYSWVSVIKTYFHPGLNTALAIPQLGTSVQTSGRFLSKGMTTT